MNSVFIRGFHIETARMDHPTKPEYRLFVVAIRNGIPEGSLFHDDPKTYPFGVIYKLRLDLLDDAAKWCALSLADLMEVWWRLQEKGALPASNVTNGT